MAINGLGYSNYYKSVYKSETFTAYTWFCGRESWRVGTDYTLYALSLNNRLILYRNFSV